MIRYSFAAIALFFISITAHAQLVSIATARAQSAGSTVTVRGIVTSGAELGTIRYMQDGTAGIAVYDFNFAPLRGDSVEVTGTLSDFNGLLEIGNITGTIISSGNPLPTPAAVTIPQMNTADDYEAQLIQISSITFSSTGTFSNSSTNYTFTDGSNTGQARIDQNNNIGGTPIPVSTVDIIGVLGEYNGTNQLFPRDLNDIVSPGNPPIIVTPLTQSNITQNSFTVSFTTQNDGNTIIEYGLTPSLGLAVSNAAMNTSHSMNLNLLTASTVYYVQGKSVSATGDTSESAIVPMITASNSTGKINVFFTNPVDLSKSTGTPAVYLNNSMADTIIKYMNLAQSTLDIAIYNLDNDNGIVDAINAAYQRGVVVRVVCNEAVNTSAYGAISIGANNKKLSPTGTAPNGEFYGIMHNKFMVVDANSVDPDSVWVIAGSTNWTDGQLNDDKNNMVLVQDQSLAKAYRMEFEEMFGNTWGPMKTDNTPHWFKIDGVPVELYFSPSDDPETQILNTVASANYDLYFSMLTFTRTAIAYDIADKVDLEAVFAAGIVDDTSSGGGDAYTICHDAFPSRMFIDNQPNIYHHKYLIVDANCPSSDPVVETGSHNWTNAAKVRNDENMLIIHDASIANQYYQEFSQRFLDNGGTEYVNGMCVTGVEELLQNEQLVIYPNPATAFAYLLTDNHEQKQIEITDLTGKIVWKAQTSDSIISLDITSLNSGTYLVSVLNNQKRSVTKLVVVR